MERILVLISLEPPTSCRPCICVLRVSHHRRQIFSFCRGKRFRCFQRSKLFLQIDVIMWKFFIPFIVVAIVGISFFNPLLSIIRSGFIFSVFETLWRPAGAPTMTPEWPNVQHVCEKMTCRGVELLHPPTAHQCLRLFLSSSNRHRWCFPPLMLLQMLPIPRHSLSGSTGRTFVS